MECMELTSNFWMFWMIWLDIVRRMSYAAETKRIIHRYPVVLLI